MALRDEREGAIVIKSKNFVWIVPVLFLYAFIGGADQPEIGMHSFVDVKSHIAEEVLPLAGDFGSLDGPSSVLRLGSPTSDVRVIFIHGSPGEKEGYLDYLRNPDLESEAQLISPDRPGYGGSKSPLFLSLLAQAKALAPLLSGSSRTILVGHSLGSPIAVQLALLYPEKVSGMLLVASAFSPELEEPKWYNRLADTWLLKQLLPEKLLKSNREMMVLQHELELLVEQDWSTLSMPVRLLHGKDDNIAHPENSLFALRQFSAETATLRMVDNEGHFILWQNVPLVVSELMALIKAIGHAGGVEQVTLPDV